MELPGPTAAPLLALLVLAASGEPARAAPGDEASACALRGKRDVDPDPAPCASCHEGGSGSGHVVDVDYEGAQARRWGRTGLRPLAEVVRRGVFLPEGRIQCLTCHDSRSEVPYHLALPPAAPLYPTWERGAPAGRRRDLIDPRELCLACHVIG
jgi:hypothetical protein